MLFDGYSYHTAINPLNPPSLGGYFDKLSTGFLCLGDTPRPPKGGILYLWFWRFLYETKSCHKLLKDATALLPFLTHSSKLMTHNYPSLPLQSHVKLDNVLP